MTCSFSQVIITIFELISIPNCFTGESMDPKGMIILVEYKEVNGEERPVVMFFKHGLDEEKC